MSEYHVLPEPITNPPDRDAKPIEHSLYWARVHLLQAMSMLHPDKTTNFDILSARALLRDVLGILREMEHETGVRS